MSNVLPTASQKEIWSFHRANLILVGSLVLLAGACIALLTLVPSVIATGFYEENKIQEGDGGLLTAAEAEAEKNEMLRAKALITAFMPLATSTSPSFEAVTAALSVRPKGALVTEIRYSKLDAGTIVINGTATDRATISAYRNALDEIPSFKTVTVPVGVFAGAEGGKFSITLTGAF